MGAGCNIYEEVGDYTMFRLGLTTCAGCSLCGSRRQVVCGSGPVPPPYGVMLVGEAPGKSEDIKGAPFIGASGTELDLNYLRVAGLRRRDIRVENIICCHPPKDRTPYADEIEACRHWLWESLLACQPEYVIALGKTACQWFAGPEFDLTLNHGIPRKLQASWPGGVGTYWLLPSYHPAAAMREGSKIDMKMIFDDMTGFKELLVTGEFDEERDKLAGREDYSVSA